MGKTSFKFNLLLAGGFIFATGCGNEPSVDGSLTGVSEGNRVVSNAYQPAPAKVKSPEEEAIESARDFLDSGENANAMRIARSLLKSSNAEVQSQLVDIFGWIGKKALPELEELIASRNPNVSTSALSAWEMAVEEINGEFSKNAAITNAAVKYSDAAIIDSILMHINIIDEASALMVLEGLVVNSKGTPAAARAKHMFEHIAGEPYSSPERTLLLIRERNAKIR